MTAREPHRRPFPWMRVLSAVLAILILGIVIWVGLPLLLPAWLILAVLAIIEYGNMLALKGIPIRVHSLVVITPLTALAALPDNWLAALGLPDVPGPGVSWRELLIVLVAVYLVVLELIRPNRNSLNSVVFSLFGFLYIPLLLSYIISLRHLPDAETGMWFMAFPILTVVFSDVGAYVIGSLFGKRKLAPLISPKKTVEGAIGGLTAGLLATLGLDWLARAVFGVDLPIGNVWLFALVVAAAGQAGDLFESLLKRWAGIKDSGTFLPGQGGVLDRIDSQIFAVPFSFMFLTLFSGLT